LGQRKEKREMENLLSANQKEPSITKQQILAYFWGGQIKSYFEQGEREK